LARESGLRAADDPVKMTKLIAGFSIVFLAMLSAHAQGPFQNLDFESANLSPIPSGQYGGDVPITSALPGWSASIGGVQVTQVLQNNSTIGTASIDILGPNLNSVEPGIIDGNYTVFLQAFNVGQGNMSLWQNGTVPANARSLQFSAWSYLPPFAAFTVSFDGNTLSAVLLSSGQTAAGQPYSVYGVNIAPYADETGQLEFTSLANNNGPSWIELDDILFSTTPVPEPNILALTTIGWLLFGARKWFNNGGHPGGYATNTLSNAGVFFSGNSGWYIMASDDSYNGERPPPDYNPNQSTFITWFASNSFGGSNYSSTPVGAITHVFEPGGTDDTYDYYGNWASGKSFTISAWQTFLNEGGERQHVAQAVGEPLVRK
jgi:hypothetical protein